VRAAGWSPDGRIRADLTVSRLRREQWNLLFRGRPGAATLVEAEGGWRIGSRLDLSGGFREETGGGWRDWSWRVGFAALL
jgi:hypothetical protein